MSLFKELRGNLPINIGVPYVAAGGAGGGSFLVPNNMKIVSASMVWGAAITGAATNFFTVSFFNRGAAGAGTTQWGTAVPYSNGTNATKANPVTVALSATAADLLLAASDVVSIEITTSGTGLVCPGGTLRLVLRNR